MAVYAQFFSLSSAGDLIEACGDRSIVRLDGRMSQLNMEHVAQEECRKRNYVAWQLIRGESLLRVKPFTKIVSLFY